MGPGSPNTPPVDPARRQALIDALMGVPARVGSAFTNMAQQGLAANERFMQGEGADQAFWPTADSGGRIGALASFLASNMAIGGPAGSLGAGPTMRAGSKGAPQVETIYRGVSSVSKPQGNYWTGDREFARQFTQSGLDKEILQGTIDAAKIYSPPTLPFAGNEAAMDAAIEAAKQGGFYAVRVSEGAGQPPSLFFIDPSKVNRAYR